MVEGGGEARKGGKENSREERELCLYREREREGEFTREAAQTDGSL